MPTLKQLPPGLWIVLSTLFFTYVAYLLRGEALFSPGALHRGQATTVARGGVHAHGDLAMHCSACHANPGSGGSMESLCLACHTDIEAQIEQRDKFHGRIANAKSCLVCHTEHRGEQASITDWRRFDHSVTAFPLTGQHVAVSCQSCHAKQVYQGTSTSCVSCHAEPKVHLGRFGTNCAQCHTTVAWTKATLTADAHSFPIYHGGGKRRGECSTCHTQPDNFQTYTCYECHQHEPKKMAEKHRKLKTEELDRCADCHPTGRKHRHQPPKEKELRRISLDESPADAAGPYVARDAAPDVNWVLLADWLASNAGQNAPQKHQAALSPDPACPTQHGAMQSCSRQTWP